MLQTGIMPSNREGSKIHIIHDGTACGAVSARDRVCAGLSDAGMCIPPGSPSEPGLLPRALDMLFNSVESRLYGRLDVQPRGFSDVLPGLGPGRGGGSSS